MSIVGSTKIIDCLWRDNTVTGFGAVLYLYTGDALISNVQMLASNWEET
jgi:hypothetical protein